VLWPKAPKGNILQSWFYGESKKEADNMDMNYFSIRKEHSEVAIVQVLSKKVPFFGRLYRVNRGPILLGEFNAEESETILLDSIALLTKELRNRSALMIQIAPEIEASEKVNTSLKKMGLKRLKSESWSSGIIDLRRDEEDILMSLNGKWRNCYRKGLKMGVEVSNVSNTKEGINKLVENYKVLQSEKDFSGLATSLIESMANQDHEKWSFNIFEAKSKDSGEDLGSLVSINSGECSIYLIGTTSYQGRKYQANYVLLWEAIMDSKDKDSRWFDIGGLNSTTPKGVAHFKKGLNAEMYSLTGEWRGIFFPKIL